MNEERNYRKIKENIRMMKSKRGNTERNKMVKDGINMVIEEIIKQNERINNNL